MKPRVFISSTYYDLKYVRETLEHFIMQYGFDAVLFESGNVTFEHGKPLDTSCYQEVDTCHMMILIIGGRYGSASSTETEIEIRKKYDEQYASITKSEFDTANTRNIPVFIFIDKNVHSEYQTYKKNEKFFENIREINKANKPTKENYISNFNFAHVDSINVFKFIDHVYHLPIKTFERADEIIEYLRAQLAGMFYLYLDQAKREGTNREILNSVEQLNSTASKIDTLVDAIARKVIDEEQFKELEKKQFNSVLEIFIENLDKHIDITPSDFIEEDIAIKLADILIKDLFEKDLDLENSNEFKNSYKNLTKDLPDLIANKILKTQSTILINNKASLLSPYRQYVKNIKPFMNNDEKKSIFKRYLTNFFMNIFPF